MKSSCYSLFTVYFDIFTEHTVNEGNSGEGGQITQKEHTNLRCFLKTLSRQENISAKTGRDSLEKYQLWGDS